MGLGKYVHYTFDLLLVLMVLAGVRRNTGLTFNPEEFHLLDIRRWASKYLALGETGFDWAVLMVRHSGYFRQRTIRDDFTEEVRKQLLD